MSTSQMVQKRYKHGPEVLQLILFFAPQKLEFVRCAKMYLFKLWIFTSVSCHEEKNEGRGMVDPPASRVFSIPEASTAELRTIHFPMQVVLVEVLKYLKSIS